MALEIKIVDNKIFAPLLQDWLKYTPEEEARQKLICKLINHYGYDLNQMAQDVTIRKRYKADIAIWKSVIDKQTSKIPSIIIAVEVKGEHIKVKEEDYLIGYNVASIVHANFFIASNLKEEKIFYVVKEPKPKKLEKLKDIPNAAILTDKRKIEKYISDIKEFTRDEFSKLLFKCHNIIRNNDKLSPEAAFDEISKILFMKIRYERNPDEANIFSLDVFKSQESHYEKNEKTTNVKLHGPKADIPYMDYWFELTKADFATDELFEEGERIRIKQGSFEAIVRELEKYNLSDTSDDIKGIAFEEFLGKTFRGELGQFFTPRTIVEYMVHLLDPQEGETVCDPCCGSGGFLIKTFEYIKNKIELDIQKSKDKIKSQLRANFDQLTEKKQTDIEIKLNDIYSKLNLELDLKNPDGRLRTLSFDCIFGTDANPRMARTAKMNMIMHGDGHGGVHHNDGLINVNGIFESRFDIILTNPPFGARVDKSLKITLADLPTAEKIEKYKKMYIDYGSLALAQITENMNKPIISLFDLGSVSGLTEVLFIERCLKLLKPGGRLGIVLPEGVLNNTALQKVRDYVEGKAKILNITSIPQDVFIASGATVKPSLLFLKKFNIQEAKQYDQLKNAVTEEVNKTYENEVNSIKIQLDNTKSMIKSSMKKEEVKKLNKGLVEKLKRVLIQIDDEIRKNLKVRFNYLVPVVEVEKAGVSSTGASIENDLLPVCEEFTSYRKQNKLWDNHLNSYKYIIDKSTQKLVRIRNNQPPTIFYN